MTDKVQKIREEVEKLKSQLLRGACSSQIAMETRCKEEAYNEVLAILDTMQEEPVSMWHDPSKETPTQGSNILMVRKEEEDTNFPPIAGCFHGTNSRLDGRNWGYYNGFCYNEIEPPIKWAYIDDILNLSNVERTAKNWKEPVSEDLGEYIDKLSKQFPEVSFAKLSRIAVRVAKWQKEQMIAKAIDVKVKVDAGGYPYIPQMELYDYDKDVPLAKAGDRYKMILIKEG